MAYSATAGHASSPGTQFALTKFRPPALPSTLITRPALRRPDARRMRRWRRLTPPNRSSWWWCRVHARWPGSRPATWIKPPARPRPLMPSPWPRPSGASSRCCRPAPTCRSRTPSEALERAVDLRLLW